MSRAAGGTYTLPAGNPVVTGTIISSTWGNTTLSDIATALTDSLSRSGLGGMTAPLLVADGTQALPAYSWTNEPSSGFYRIGAGNIGLSVLNRLTWNVTSAGNMTIATPSAGTTLTLNAVVAGLPLSMTDGTVTATATFAGTAFSIGPTSAHTLNLNTNGSTRIAMTSAGNVTITAPSSGTAFTLNGVAGGAPMLINAGSEGSSFSTYQVSAVTRGYFGVGSGIGATATNFGIRSETGLSLLAGGGTERVLIGSAGNVTINAPSSGVALTLTGVSGSSPLTVNNSGATVASAVQLYEPLFSAAAVKTAATYETGTFTGTLTGCTTSPSGTFNWTRVGNVVTIDCVVTIAATSNTTACTITGVPAALNPARNMTAAGFIQAEDNTVFSVGSVQVGTSGTLILAHSTATVPSVTFTAAGTKGFSGMCITYPLT